MAHGLGEQFDEALARLETLRGPMPVFGDRKSVV